MGYLSHFGLGVLLFFLSLPLYAEQTAKREVRILGRKVTVSQIVSDFEDPEIDAISESGVESRTQVALFGKKIELARSMVKYRVSEDEGISFNSNFYVNGRKILAHGFLNGDGIFAYTADIPAAEISGDIFSYSLGILRLGINSGVTYEGALKSHVSSELLKKEKVWATDMNLIDSAVEVQIKGQGYIEGQVKVLFIRGGVGGAINLIEGGASASIKVNPTTVYAPEVAYEGIVHLLSGELYAYVGSGKSKWLSHSFYKSKGQCYSFGDSSCQI